MVARILGYWDTADDDHRVIRPELSTNCPNMFGFVASVSVCVWVCEVCLCVKYI